MGDKKWSAFLARVLQLLIKDATDRFGRFAVDYVERIRGNRRRINLISRIVCFATTYVWSLNIIYSRTTEGGQVNVKLNGNVKMIRSYVINLAKEELCLVALSIFSSYKNLVHFINNFQRKIYVR